MLVSFFVSFLICLLASYPTEIKEERESNLTFSKSKGKGKHQAGDFLLEQKIKRQKFLSPKGIVDKKTWQQISRSVDKIEDIYQNASSYLNLNEETQTRNVLLGDEILEWRAILRYSQLLVNSESETVFNIHGESLSDEMSQLNTVLKEQMDNYWAAHLNGEKLATISTRDNVDPLEEYFEIDEDELY